MKINILGINYQIKLYKADKFPPRGKKKNIAGYTQYEKKIIEVGLVEYQEDHSLRLKTIHKILGHEIGHAVEEEMIGTIAEGEGIPSHFESIPSLLKQVKDIMNEIIKINNNILKRKSNV